MGAYNSGSSEATTVTDTNSINLTLTGADITADVLYSADAGNVAQAGTDGGVLVPTDVVTGAGVAPAGTDVSNNFVVHTAADGTVTFFSRVTRVRDSIINSDAVAISTAVGSQPTAIIAVAAGTIVEWHVSADDVGLDGTVDVELVIAGLATGTTINVAAGGAPVAAAISVAYTAGQTWSWRTVAGTATTGNLADVQVTIEIER